MAFEQLGPGDDTDICFKDSQRITSKLMITIMSKVVYYNMREAPKGIHVRMNYKWVSLKFVFFLIIEVLSNIEKLFSKVS